METDGNSNVVRRKILFALIKIAFEAVEFAFVTGRECACDSPVDAGSGVREQSNWQTGLPLVLSHGRFWREGLLVMIFWR